MAVPGCLSLAFCLEGLVVGCSALQGLVQTDQDRAFKLPLRSIGMTGLR